MEKEGEGEGMMDGSNEIEMGSKSERTTATSQTRLIYTDGCLYPRYQISSDQVA